MDPRDQIMARMYVVLTLFSLLPLLVAGQVLRIYLTDGGDLRARGERQFTSQRTIPAVRGAILDRAGRTLAVNTARYDLALDPTANGFTPAVAATFFERLSKLTGRPASGFRSSVQRRSSPQYVLLLRAVTERQKEEIESWDVPGVLMAPTFARRYNYGATASHVLGHVGVDGEGLAGLELQYESHLNGIDGYRIVKRDRLGVTKAYVQGKAVEPRHGESLVLTIDLIRQTILEEELARGVAESGSTWGTAIAMDPHTGAILAMANVPTYDPNRAASFPADARRNRAVTDRIEPGSTFKLVAAVAAVEQGLVALDDSVETGQGWAVFGGRTMKDTRAHGTITFEDVIALSSNVGTARTALRIKPGVFYQYARNLGFGQPTWIDLPGEVPGLLKKPAEWSGTTLTSMSIGYEVDVTPLQMLAAYAALSNGGLLVQPFVVAERRDVVGRTVWKARQDSIRRAFDRKTAAALRPAFERAVEEGTARLAHVDGLTIAGKTGTAQKASGGSYNQSAYRASFVGFFPVDDPQVAMIVVLDEPRIGSYGGAVAAPVFQRVAKRWIGTFPTIASRVAPPQPLPAVMERAVPNVQGAPASVAMRDLVASGFRVKAPPASARPRLVVDQRPAAGTETGPGAQMQLVLAEDARDAEATMPDLTGRTARSAAYWLRLQGVAVQLEGRGTVVSQSPPAGSPIPAAAVLRCR